MKLFQQLLLPTAASVLTVLGLFELEGTIHEWFYPPDPYDDAAIRATYLFNRAILPVLIGSAVLFQALIIVPLWRKYQRVNRCLGLTRWQMAGVWCLAGSGLVSFPLWVPTFGLTDLLIILTTAFVGLAFYWTVNFWVLHQLDNRFT